MPVGASHENNVFFGLHTKFLTRQKGISSILTKYKLKALKSN